MRVARPKWAPQSEEQRRAIARVERAAKNADEADGKLWAAITEAHTLGVPTAHLAQKAGRTRATIYRHLPQDERAPPGG